MHLVRARRIDYVLVRGGGHGAGLVTVPATTTAGAGAYLIHDAGTSAGLAVADAAVPELLAPFLERCDQDVAVRPLTGVGEPSSAAT